MRLDNTLVAPSVSSGLNLGHCTWKSVEEIQEELSAILSKSTKNLEMYEAIVKKLEKKKWSKIKNYFSERKIKEFYQIPSADHEFILDVVMKNNTYVKTRPYLKSYKIDVFAYDEKGERTWLKTVFSNVKKEDNTFIHIQEEIGLNGKKQLFISGSTNKYNWNSWHVIDEDYDKDEPVH